MSGKKDYYISDEELARRLGVERKSVVMMINKYKDTLEELGEIIIEERKTSADGQSRKYRLLTTREQYYLLVFYAKNTEKGVELKRHVVEEMFALRDKRRDC